MRRLSPLYFWEPQPSQASAVQIVLHALACRTISLVLTTQLASHAATVPMLSIARLLAWSLSGPCKKFLENLCEIDYLVVPWWSPGYVNMFSTLLPAVDRYRSARPTEATSLLTCVEAHVLLLWSHV